MSLLDFGDGKAHVVSCFLHVAFQLLISRRDDNVNSHSHMERDSETASLRHFKMRSRITKTCTENLRFKTSF